MIESKFGGKDCYHNPDGSLPVISEAMVELLDMIGKFTEVMLIRDNRDMDIFLEKYDISVAEIKTEW